jgi:ATP/maltotriose-dependent transcriptional regulator MalT
MSQSKNAQPRLRDVRRIYRLLWECTELNSDSNAWRTHLLEGVSRIIGARVGLYMHLHDPLQETERLEAAMANGFLDTDHLALWQHYQENNAQKDDPYHLSYYHDHHRPLRTRSLDEVVASREWKRSLHYNEYVRACKLGDRITSSLRLNGDEKAPLQTLVFHRDEADGKFSASAKYLVKLMHHEMAELLGHKLVLPETRRDTGNLPSRMTQVLDHLLNGQSEKQIATHLGISHHTVNRHVQRLYQHFGVNSRGKLVALLSG